MAQPQTPTRNRQKEVIAELKRVITQEFLELRLAYESDRPYWIVAYLARNLLELYVWTKYSLQSNAEASRFYEDSTRDLMDAMRAPSPTREDTERFLKQRADLIAFAKHFGFESVADPYTRVSKAAKAVDMKTFDTLNKLLSKFAHPTAMRIFACKAGSWGVEEQFVQFGLFLGNDALRLIGEFEQTSFSPFQITSKKPLQTDREA